jgi:hypothetical protein
MRHALLIATIAAESADDLKLPTGYRTWFHVNTMHEIAPQKTGHYQCPSYFFGSEHFRGTLKGSPT